jgi:hypothetical protein
LSGRHETFLQYLLLKVNNSIQLEYTRTMKLTKKEASKVIETLRDKNSSEKDFEFALEKLQYHFDIKKNPVNRIHTKLHQMMLKDAGCRTHNVRVREDGTFEVFVYTYDPYRNELNSEWEECEIDYDKIDSEERYEKVIERLKDSRNECDSYERYNNVPLRKGDLEP